MLLVTRPYIGAVNFEILTLGFDDDGHLWNLPRMGAFVFHNTSCFSGITQHRIGNFYFMKMAIKLAMRHHLDTVKC
jgi:hypothetical protein